MAKIQQLFLLTLLTIWISHATTEAEFTYFGIMGPEHWSEHYNQCSGKHQSPINIREVDVEHRNYSDIYYENFGEPPESITLLNNGHTVLVKMIYNGSVPTISHGPLEGKGKYKFQQLHFHWGENNTVGSEDRINNMSFPMELHAVFSNEKYGSFEEAVREDDGIAVLAAFYEVSKTRSNYNFDVFTSHFKDIEQPHTETKITQKIELYNLLDLNMDSYYTYVGSLTTPPCSEDVVWIDYVNPIKISPDMIARFRNLKTYDGKSLTHNFRPLQPLNNRKVFKAVEMEKSKINDGGLDIMLVSAWDEADIGRNTAHRSTSPISLIRLISIFLAVFILNTGAHN